MKKLSLILTSLLLAVCLIFLNVLPLSATGQTDTKANATSRNDYLTVLDNDYRSRTETVYHGINGSDVTVYGFYREYLESGNNPNFSQILMVWQCIKYKEKHPEKDVTITIQSFHFSVVLAGCVDPTKPDYGHTKNLFNSDYDENGYYRLSYLLVEAAKKGIEVIVIGQLDAGGTEQGEGIIQDLNFVEYFSSHLSDSAYISGRKVSDYMTFRYCQWKSYGDKSAADMMHNKTCTVTNYIDNSGVEHGAAIWAGSTNIDGVNHLEQTGNDLIQNAVIIAGHEKLRQIIYNFTKIMTDYCSQEDIVPFRALISAMNTEQIKILSDGGTIDADEQIVYPGTENDKVFELYFTPLGGNFSTWDKVNNPYAKYISKMLECAESDEYIEFIWNNVKYVQTFELADIMMEAVCQAFVVNNNKQSLLSLELPGVDASFFNALTQGENIGYKNINGYSKRYHTKDFLLSYVDNGERLYITVLNSLNIHEGSMYHQSNTIIVIKESESIGCSFYTSTASLTTPEVDFIARRK